jgi:hypothetical protein
MSSRRPLAALAAALLAVVVGCGSSGIDVSTSADPLARFPAQATFGWDASASKMPDDPRIRELDLDPRIREAARAAFAARGYREVASGGDYRLSYEVGENRWYGPEGTTSVVSVSLMLVDAKTDRRVWLGFGRAEVQTGRTPEERAKRLRDAFDRMLADFPPAGGAR